MLSVLQKYLTSLRSFTKKLLKEKYNYPSTRLSSRYSIRKYNKKMSDKYYSGNNNIFTESFQNKGE